MRKRKPDGAHLLPARRKAVEDAPGHNEVSPGVVMAQGEPGMRVEQRGSRTDDEGGKAESERDAIEFLHRRAGAAV